MKICFMTAQGRAFHHEKAIKCCDPTMRATNKIAKKYDISIERASAIYLVMGMLIEGDPSFINQLNGDKRLSDGQKVVNRVKYYLATEGLPFDIYEMIAKSARIVKDMADTPRFNKRKNGDNIFTFTWRIISEAYAKMDDVPSVMAEEHIMAVA